MRRYDIVDLLIEWLATSKIGLTRETVRMWGDNQNNWNNRNGWMSEQLYNGLGYNDLGV